jgi:hypothetical protein
LFSARDNNAAGDCNADMAFGRHGGTMSIFAETVKPIAGRGQRETVLLADRT